MVYACQTCSRNIINKHKIKYKQSTNTVHRGYLSKILVVCSSYVDVFATQTYNVQYSNVVETFIKIKTERRIYCFAATSTTTTTTTTAIPTTTTAAGVTAAEVVSDSGPGTGMIAGVSVAVIIVIAGISAVIVVVVFRYS